MKALNPLPNMVVSSRGFGAGNTSPTLTNFAPKQEARMAETSPNFILISRQGQPCNRGVLAHG